jgi:hypothetical protein
MGIKQQEDRGKNLTTLLAGRTIVAVAVEGKK